MNTNFYVILFAIYFLSVITVAYFIHLIREETKTMKNEVEELRGKAGELDIAIKVNKFNIDAQTKCLMDQVGSLERSYNEIHDSMIEAAESQEDTERLIQEGIKNILNFGSKEQ